MKGRSNPNYQHGLFQGWREFRYGNEPKPITLAGKPKEAPALRGERKKHVINKVMDVMRDWRQTPFEHEGAARAGLRSALCLDGIRWSRADIQAEEIVADCLRRLGAKRPTWDEGQPGAVAPRDNCAWCWGAMPAEALAEGRTARFCSADCARNALLKVDHEDVASYRAAHAKVAAIAKREKAPPAVCLQCSEPFQPMKIKNRWSKFCSRTCAWDYQRVPKKRCLECGTMFRPQNKGGNAGTFCSMACKSKHGSLLRFNKTCDWCGTSFVAKQDAVACCGPRCRDARYNLLTGRRPLKQLTAPAFDYVMRMAA